MTPVMGGWPLAPIRGVAGYEKDNCGLQVSVDDFIEGPNGELDWAMAEDEETWKDIFETLGHVDTFDSRRGKENS